MERHALLDRDQVIDLETVNIQFLCLEKLLEYFCSMFFCTAKNSLIIFYSISQILSQEYGPVNFIIHPDTPISNHIINKHWLPTSIGSHSFPCHNTASPVLHMLHIMSCFSPSPKLIPKCYIFSYRSVLDLSHVFWQSLVSSPWLSLYSVVCCKLYFHSCTHLLIEDSDSDTPASSSRFLA